MTPLNIYLTELGKEEIEHYDKFRTLPVIIGLYKNDIVKLINNIKKAIETNKPYNEYNLLSDEEKKAFDKGELLF